MDKNTAIYEVYTSRWKVLVVFSIANFCNSILWITFAPIQDLTGIYIDGSFGSGTNTAVSML